MESKKVVMEVAIYNERTRTKAMKTASGYTGVDSIQVDVQNKKLTVTGDVDPVCLVGKLRKHCKTKIVSVGAAKEPEKKPEVPKIEETWNVSNYQQSYPPMTVICEERRTDDYPPVCCIIS